VRASAPSSASIRGDFHWTNWEIGVVAKGVDDLEGRDGSQLRALRAVLDAPLRAFQGLAMNDTDATVTMAASPWDADRLDDALAKMESLANAIALASKAIPPPHAMSAHLDAWRDAERTMGGRLCVGSMCLRDLSLENARAAIETTFDRKGTPAATRLVVQSDGRVPKSFVGAASGEIAQLVAEPVARAIADVEAGGERSLRVEDDAVVLDLPAVTADPTSLRALLADLVALVRAFGGDGVHGPYR
jgi:hypothetical protein